MKKVGVENRCRCRRKCKPTWALYAVLVVERRFRRDGRHADFPGKLLSERSHTERHWLKINDVKYFGISNAIKLAKKRRSGVL